jgi:hypothetical protein
MLNDRRKRSRDFAREIAENLVGNWPGLVNPQGWADHHRAREIRNSVIQLMNRRIFSRDVSGDHEAHMKGMTCGILDLLMDETGAPRGGLASILGVHSTRASAVLEEKRWPPKARDVRSYFLNATLWMFLGGNWREEYTRFRVRDRSLMWSQFPDIKHGTREWSLLWAVRAAEDIVDYFFPEPSRETPPSYFQPVRREWSAPFDRNELGLVARWTRRIIKAKDTRVAYIAFFVHNCTAAESLFSHELLARNIAYGPLETKGDFRVDVLFPEYGSGGIPNKNLFKPLKTRLHQLSAEEAILRGNTDRLTPSKGKDEFRFVQFESESRKTSPASSRALRAIVSFMFVGYVFEKAGTETPFEHLTILRPYLQDDETTPFALELSSGERTEFVEAAADRYDVFKEQLAWLRNQKSTRANRS